MISICIVLRSPESALLEDMLFATSLASCRSYRLVSLSVVEFCMVLTQSCCAMEGFGMVLLQLLRLAYKP